jgi:hypothetical protein
MPANLPWQSVTHKRASALSLKISYSPWRAELLAHLGGDVLEIGAGTEQAT